MGGGLKHGTGNAYANHRCRCDECRAWRRISSEEYRKRQAERFREQRRAEYARNPEKFQARTKKRLDRIRRVLERYKLWCGCARCGYRDNARALEFHHRDPALKEFNVSERKGRAWKRTKAEVRKCDVLCSNCHKIEEAAKWAI